MSDTQTNPNETKTDSGADLAALRSQLAEREAKLTQIEKERNDAKEAELRKNNEWKTLAEAAEARAKAAEEKAKKYENSYIGDRKFSAIKEAAQKLGLRPEAVEDLESYDFGDAVSLETTSKGRVNVLGAEKAVERLKTLKPHYFQDPNVNVNTGQPGIKTGSKVSVDDVVDAERAYRKSGLKSDHGKYQETLRKYQAQGA